jgi:hypothetical protein
LDGTPATVVTGKIPSTSLIGKDSWTVSAWVKPQQFSIDSSQNQRRLFMVGSYPAASFNVDITAAGNISVFECYQVAGNTHAAGAQSQTRLTEGRWAYIAVVCNRSSGSILIYINGIQRGDQRMPPDFQPDLNVTGDFSVGCGWHNFWGLVNDAQLYNRALSPSEIKAEFAHLKGTFKVVPTPDEAAADALEAAEEALNTVNQARAKGDFPAVRKGLLIILSRPDLPVAFRSYAHLRLAQSLAISGRASAARAEFVKIAGIVDYPDVHRMEARERIVELDRLAKGLPARDPATSRPVVPKLPTARLRIFVASTGNDANPGTAGRPLATLTAARNRVRSALAVRKPGTIEVDVAPGRYRIAEALTLSNQDSGTTACPVVYRAQQAGTAVFYGGAKVTGFKPVTDPDILARLPIESRGKVVQVDLRALGITDYGALAVRGFGQAPSPPTLELYVNGHPQTLARWPNKGFVLPTKLVDPGNIDRGTPSILGYGGDRPERWKHAEDPWLFGYFQFHWADGTARIAKIDPVAKTLTTAAPYHYASTGMTMEQGIKYYAYNLLEEIDVPGEWYLNRQTGILYLYPPAALPKSTVEISMLSTPMVNADHVSHVRFDGLTFDLGRFDGISLTDCSDCQLVGCTVRRFAGNGVCVHGGSRDSVQSCDVYDLGRRGVEIIGGDRETLTPGGHIVANCKIHDFGRIDRTYTPAVQLEGVGNRVDHNVFYNGPSSAIRIEGNDHIVEYNEFHDVVRESDDQGAIDIFGNPTYRGVVFRYNYFHDIGSDPNEPLVVGQAGIRLDDAISGMLIYGNTFIRSGKGIFGGVQINSGRDNVIANNLFANSDKGVSGGYYGANGAWNELRAGKTAAFITSDLYRRRYPALAWALKEPGMNFLWGNVFSDVGHVVTGDRAGLELVGNSVLTNQGPPPPIPLNEIGLYRDSWRISL